MDNNFRVTVQYVDFPMGVSPAYAFRNYLTEEEAKKLAKELNNDVENNPSGSVYRVYDVEK